MTHTTKGAAIMSVTTTRPTTAEVQGRMEDEDGTAIGRESAKLKTRIAELESTLADGSSLSLHRDWEGTVIAIIEGDPRFTVLYLTDQGRVAYGGINQPAFYPTVAAWLEADGRAC